MMIVGLGVPSQFTAWGFEIIKRLVAASGAKGPVKYVDRFDAVAPAGKAGATFLAQLPSADLIGLSGRPDVTTTLFDVPPLTSVRHQMAHRSTFMNALRGATASASLISSYLHYGSCLAVSETDAAEPEALIARIAQHHGLAVKPAAMAAILREVGPPPAEQVPPSEPSDDELTIVAQVLDQLFAHLARPEIEPRSVWPYRVFLSGDRPNEAAALVAEVTGGSRIIYYGPYFHLPAGTWRARFTLGFSDTAIGMPFSLKAHSTQPLGEARILPRRPGIFAAEFSFAVADPAQPIEFHIMSVEGAIEGRFALAQIELIPAGPPPARSNAPAALAAATPQA